MPRHATTDARSARRARWLLALAALVFTLFCLSVLLGKARTAFGWETGLALPDVPEFLLLLFSALFFTLAALAREKAVGSRNDLTDDDGRTDPANTTIEGGKT